MRAPAITPTRNLPAIIRTLEGDISVIRYGRLRHRPTYSTVKTSELGRPSNWNRFMPIGMPAEVGRCFRKDGTHPICRSELNSLGQFDLGNEIVEVKWRCHRVSHSDQERKFVMDNCDGSNTYLFE